jgi:hypothetical protein
MVSIMSESKGYIAQTLIDLCDYVAVDDVTMTGEQVSKVLLGGALWQVADKDALYVRVDTRTGDLSHASDASG